MPFHSQMKSIRELIETVSPILISPKKDSLTFTLSKRFLVFQAMSKLVSVIEEDPDLNFIALLKSYKVLGRFLNGTLYEFHRDKNKQYFRSFFLDKSLYESVKDDLEYLYPKYKDIHLTITKRGLIIYHNYKKNTFNVLLMTMHSGSWVPEAIEKKLTISRRERRLQEDIETNRIYCKLVLDKGGIWIDNKQSRFVVDFNRSWDRAIYANNSEEWLNVVWKDELTKKESEIIYASYREFYFTLARLLDSYHFNIIFDAHSMNERPGRPNISFGTRYIPRFYMPIVKGMQRKMITLGYSPVLLNTPYSGGHILFWLSSRFPHVFIFSMEINKKLYLKENGLDAKKRTINQLSLDISYIFDIELEDDAVKG